MRTPHKRTAKERLKFWYTDVEAFITRNEMYIIIAYFVSLATFFCVQFYLLQNWDMLVRILNSNFLFHNGYYFETQRALLESLVIGAFSFIFGGYAVYAFLTMSAAVFTLSAVYAAKAFEIKPILLISALSTPFLIFYGTLNGSELFMMSFLLLFVSAVKLKKYYAGLFLALAVVSKYDALYFAVLFLFLLDRNILHSIKRLLANAAIFIAAMSPFFIYNLLSYGNFIYTIALSYFYVKNVGSSTYGVLYGFYELIPAVVFAALLPILSNLKLIKTRIKDFRSIAMLIASVVISIYIYFSATGFFPTGNGEYRFFLLASTFSIFIVLLFYRRYNSSLFIAAFVISMLIAVSMLINLYAVSQSNAANRMISGFKAVYGNSTCTVQSNDWVSLDYYGLAAEPISPLKNDSVYPIVNIGQVNTSLPQLYNNSGVFVYGLSSCNFTTVQINFLSDYNKLLESRNETPLQPSACEWLSEGSTTINSTCNYINDLLVYTLK